MCNDESGTPICTTATVTIDVLEIIETDIEISILNDIIDPNINQNVFVITNIESAPDNTVQIFNRWGVKVYETQGYDNASNAFRGISNGRTTIQQNEELPVGVYFYIVNYTINGEVQTENGYLYINR